ncbi:FxLYD domain-containing protein [Jeotgalibacillus haloalkalitolerans]|uniref:FxLYD domain-containing protein n=1 Tax=Jeotgalibacillus haloalkalitolerans TaxID=3104292 RepID=A0ABU5KPR3_9BACL|nr:FxLYD domain-containing protein [Jeotgalibacillus sp. HH7-29]MDZ5713247.1 FxLYD domain-containing protein [Jeotgalibacillus sp. HH7-29]
MNHDQSENKPSSKSPSKDFSGKKRMLTPFKFLLIVVMISILSLGTIYGYETWTNDKVTEWKSAGENAAFYKNWSTAEQNLAKAANARPEYESLRESLRAVRQAEGFQKQLTKLEEQLENGQYDNIQEEIENLTSKMKENQNELLFAEQQRMIDIKEKALLLSIKDDLNEQLSIQSLAGKLLEVSEIDEEGASELEARIVEQIASLSIRDAADELELYHFSEALDIIEIGLGYAPDNEQLQSFKEKIKTQRTAYQEEEYNRLAEAMKEAERQDHFNRTEAVSVEEWEVTADEKKIQLTGEVKNNGSRPISWIEISWSVFDEEGNVVAESLTVADPEYLVPEGTGLFTDELEVSESYEKVEIESITWYLE